MKKFLNSVYAWVILVPVLLVLAGTASNQAVLIANWGKFPVMVNDRVKAKMLAEAAAEEAKEGDDSQAATFSITDTVVYTDAAVLNPDGQFLDYTHTIMGHNSRLKFLADYVDMKTAIYSPGDGLIMLGEWLGGFALVVWVTLVCRRLHELSFVR